MNGGCVPADEIFVGSAQKYFNKSLGLNNADPAGIKGFASKSVLSSRDKRVHPEKLSPGNRLTMVCRSLLLT
jgi:hypothetical protein